MSSSTVIEEPEAAFVSSGGNTESISRSTPDNMREPQETVSQTADLPETIGRAPVSQAGLDPDIEKKAMIDSAHDDELVRKASRNASFINLYILTSTHSYP